MIHLTSNLRRAFRRSVIFLIGFCALQSLSIAQEAPTITSVTVNEEGRIVITFNGAEGEYLIECSDDLTDSSWGSLCRMPSDGTPTQATEPIDAESGQKFFRLLSIPPSNDSALTSDLATIFNSELLASPSAYTGFQTVFGITFDSSEATLLGTNGLSSQLRNARVYTAAIAALSTLAQTTLDETTFPSSQPNDDIVDAFILDLTDGEIDGYNSNSTIYIGTSIVRFPKISSQDLLDSFDTVKTAIFSLYNVEFATNGTDKVTISVPADWGTFYWDSADWE